MAELVDRIRSELDARIERLRPLVGELERLERAAAALARAGVRAMPGIGARPPARVAAKPEREPAGGSMHATPAAGPPSAQRRRTASDGTPPAAGAKSQGRPAARSPRTRKAARKPAVQRRSGASGRSAPRGQTQAKILAALHVAPGSSSAAVAAATGIPTNTAAATISRLVKQGRVSRLERGGYAPVETPADAAQSGTAPATSNAAAVTGDTAGTATPPATGSEPPR